MNLEGTHHAVTLTHQASDLSVKIPGVTTVLGEFAHYGQGRVLCCTNNQYLLLTLTDSPDNQFHIHNNFTGDRKRFSISSLKYRKEDKWANYVKGIILQLIDNGIQVKPFNLELRGPGLKSDGATIAAAVSIGVCKILQRKIGFELSDKDLIIMCYHNCTNYCNELTKYSTIVAMLHAKEGKYILFDLNTMTYIMLDDPFETGDCTFLMVDCKIPPAAMREEITYRHTQIKDAFNQLKSKYHHSLKDFPLNDLADRVIPIDEESRRMCYAVMEDKQVAATMAHTFPSHDYVQIGRGLNKVGKLIRDDLEISCPEIDWLIKRATEVPGCHGATVVFNGDNTYVALVIDNHSIPHYESRLDEYERIFGFKASTFPLKPCGKWEHHN